MVISDINEGISNRVRGKVAGAFGVDREKENGERTMNYRAKREMCYKHLLLTRGDTQVYIEFFKK